MNVLGQAAALTPITPTSGALAANTALNSIMGQLWRVLLVTVGTYAGTTLRIDGMFVGSDRAIAVSP
jgi:hypothetical protein